MQSELESKLGRLEDAFAGPNGVCGERVLALIEMEDRHSNALIGTFRGYVRLMDAFFDFFIQTMMESHKQPVPPLLSAIYLSNFWRLRASHSAFWRGYYYDASALLRGVWENVLYVGAAAHGSIHLNELFELPSGIDVKDTEALSKALHRRNQSVDSKIRSVMIGKDSGLDQAHQSTLRMVYRILHKHVHRSEFNVSDVADRLLRGETVGLFPKLDLDRASTFANITQLIAWSSVRLLPLLAPAGSLTDDWAFRYGVLDDSFAFFIDGVKQKLPPLGIAFEEFIKLRMSYPSTAPWYR